MPFAIGDKIRVRRRKVEGWLAFGDTEDRIFTITAFSLSGACAFLDDATHEREATEASVEWFEKVENVEEKAVITYKA